MIFRGFKRKTNQFFFNKQLPNFLKNCNEKGSGTVQKVLVLMDDDSIKPNILSDLKDLLELMENDIETISLQKIKSKNDTDENVFTAKDFGWYGKIKSKQLNNILTKKYDLLINYSKVENIYSNLLILQSKAAFKVGFSHFDNRLYDLMIEGENINIDLFNKELKKYLEILNKI